MARQGVDCNQHDRLRDHALAGDRSPLEHVTRVILSVLLVCWGYYASGVIGIALRFEPGGISGIWLPHGVLVAALLLTPVRRWWLYGVALLPTHLHLVSTFQGPVPLAVMLVQFVGNMAQAVLGAALVRGVLGQPPRINDLWRMSVFIAGAAFLPGCVVSAGVAWLFTITDWVSDFWIAWERRVFAQMCGAVIVAPLIIELATGGIAAIRRAPPRRIAAFVVLTAGLIAVMLPFFWLEDTRPHHVWLLFAPLPLLLWSAVRFAPGGLGLHLLAVAFVALLMTKFGRGPFATGSSAEAVVALQGFLLAISIPLMLLAALVKQHAQAAAALQESQEQYRSVVEDQTELICRLLPDGTYTFVNGAYCRYFGRTPEELLGRTFWQFLPEADRVATRKFLDSLSPDRPVATHEHQVLGPNGDIRWHQWTNRGTYDADGRLIGYQAVGRDVTDRKHAEEEHGLLEAHRRVEEALREADHRKDEFLAMLGHELRNPLAPIGMAAEILRTRAASDETIVWVHDVIARQVGHLTRLVDDLLDVSRITRGKINLNWAPLDLRRVITQAVETSRPLLVDRKHKLAIDLPDDALPVRGDDVRLAQVVSNLLNNAAKYTEAGGRIAVSAQRDGARAIVRVVDDGIGIPANMLEHVFEMFTQVQTPGDRSQGGLGIGLTLVRRLIEMHDGMIEAHSEGPGRGSEFIIWLPLALDQCDEHNALAREPDARAESPAPAERALQRAAEHKRILIVDDNVDAAESLSRMLRLEEHEVLVAHDGPSALTAAERMKPDIVLLDIGLPKMDGLEVARRLRHRANGAPPPLLVATTGFGQAEDRRRIAAAGFDHHLVKPLDPHVLQSLVRTGKPHE